MGYYSSFEYSINADATVDVKKAKELEKFFADEDNPNVGGFYGVKLLLKGDKLKGIELEEYYAKFHDDALFAEKLAEVLKTGWVRLEFTGEDGHSWGWEVVPGEVHPIDYLAVSERETVVAGAGGVWVKVPLALFDRLKNLFSCKTDEDLAERIIAILESIEEV